MIVLLRRIEIPRGKFHNGRGDYVLLRQGNIVITTSNRVRADVSGGPTFIKPTNGI